MFLKPLLQIYRAIGAFFLPAVSFLKQGIIVTWPTVANTEVRGNLVPNGGLIALLTQMANNAAPGPGDFTFNSLTGGTSLNSSQVINAFNLHLTTAGTNTLPLATTIIQRLPGGATSQAQMIGRTFLMAIANMVTPTKVTVATNTGWTLAGTMYVAALSVRWFFANVTGSQAITLTSIFENTVTS